jgi:hypothetical protein
MSRHSDMSLRPRPGESAEDVIARVTAAAKASATIELPTALLRAAVEALIPHGDETVDVSRSFLAELIEEVEATEPVCDHSVGICACSEAATLAELKLRLEGMMSCPECHGEGATWSETALSDALRYYSHRHNVSREDAHAALGDDPGYVKCSRCEGAGRVPEET